MAKWHRAFSCYSRDQYDDFFEYLDDNCEYVGVDDQEDANGSIREKWTFKTAAGYDLIAVYLHDEGLTSEIRYYTDDDIMGTKLKLWL